MVRAPPVGDRRITSRVAAPGGPGSRLRFDHVDLQPSARDDLDTNTRADLRVRALLEDHRGRLWVGTSNAGLFALDPADGERVPGARDHLRRLARTDDPVGLADDSILTLVEDKQGAIWIGTDVGGLDRLDPKTGRFVHFRNHPRQPTSLSDDRVGTLLGLADELLSDVALGVYNCTRYTPKGGTTDGR